MVRSRRPDPRAGDAAPGLESQVAALVARGEAGAAATEIIRALGPELLRQLRRLLGSEDEAAEAFARGSERIWRSLPDYRGGASLRTWAHRLVLHAALDLRRDAFRRRVRRLDTREADELPARQGTSTGQRLEQRRGRLAALREALPLEDQALLQLRIDQRLSWAECAEVLAGEGRAARPDALMKRFERLKARLATQVRRRGWGP